jgi:hypothetical protein
MKMKKQTRQKVQVESVSQLAITPIEYGGLQEAYEYFNEALFGGMLPDVLSPTSGAPTRAAISRPTVSLVVVLSLAGMSWRSIPTRSSTAATNRFARPWCTSNATLCSMRRDVLRAATTTKSGRRS